MNQERRKAAPPRQKRNRASQRRPSSGVGGKLIIMAAVVAAVVFGVAIFFKVNTVEVQGNTIYSAAEIASASGIQKGDNLFTLNKEAAAGSIKASLPYVETVSVIRFLPDKVVIEVKESDATFAVQSDTNTTWLINSVGKALEQVSDSSVSPVQAADPAQTPADAESSPDAQPSGGESVQPGENTNADAENPPAEPQTPDTQSPDTQTPDAEQPVSDPVEQAGTENGAAADAPQDASAQQQKNTPPRILGVIVTSPRAGAVVTATEPAKLDAALSVIAALDGTGILDHIVSINVEKEYDIVLQYDERYEIKLGGTEDLAYKINYLTVILDKLSDFQAGTIDLTFTDSSEARFYSKE